MGIPCAAVSPGEQHAVPWPYLSLRPGEGGVPALGVHSAARQPPPHLPMVCLSVLCLWGLFFHREKEFCCFTESGVAVFPSRIGSRLH